LNSKQNFLPEAERLYIYDFKSVDEIASTLGVHPNTIISWRNKNNWEDKRQSYFRSKQCFHEELYEFARKLMKDIMADMDAGEKVDQSRMYTFCKVIPMFSKVKDYEDVMSTKNKQTARGLTPDLIAQIEEEVLGIKPSTDLEDEE